VHAALDILAGWAIVTNTVVYGTDACGQSSCASAPRRRAQREASQCRDPA
jgi:hypothetical protein